MGASLLLLSVAGCARDKEAETAGYQPGQVQQGPQTGQDPAAPGSPQQPPAGYDQQQPGQGAPTVPGAAPGTPAQPGAPGAANPTAPGTPATATPPPGPTAQPIDPGAVSIVQPVINELARAHTVAGAKPLGAPMAGNFHTGQILETQIQLQPQKCYTVVATSLPPVTELNVQLVMATPLPNMAPVLAADSETGPTAVVGKKPNCYKWPFPVPASVKVVLEVTGGSGLAAAQVYEK